MAYKYNGVTPTNNTLWNTDETEQIAYAEQVKDADINWDSVDPNQTPSEDTPTYKLPTVWPEGSEHLFRSHPQFQTLLNEFFLKHYVEFHNFLEGKGVDGIIDTWRDVEEFLESISDSEATKLIAMIRDIQLASGQLNIRMSSSYPGAVEAVTTYDTLDISDSHIDEETGKINIIYNFE